MPTEAASWLSPESSRQKQETRTWLTMCAGSKNGCTHQQMHLFLSLPAIMEITVHLILHRSDDLIVSISWLLIKESRARDDVTKRAIKAPSGSGGGRLVEGGGHKYLPFLLSFKPARSFSNTADRPTSLPTLSLTALPGLPTAITYKTFQDPPHVVGFLKSCVPLLTWCGGHWVVTDPLNDHRKIRRRRQ